MLSSLFRHICPDLTSRNGHETHFPTRQAQTRPHTRLPRAHEDTRWSRRAERASCERPQAPDSITRKTRLRLPRTARLLRPADFAALRIAPRRLHSPLFKVEYRANACACARLGMAVSRRVSKKAVVRNRIRREIGRAHV